MAITQGMRCLPSPGDRVSLPLGNPTFFALLHFPLKRSISYLKTNWGLCLLLLLLFSWHSGKGQYINSPPIRTLDLDDGLASKRVSWMMQDHLGYLWVGTWFGLHRYNGYEFENWQHIPGDSNSLSGNLVYWILEDSKNRIWVACRRGLNLLDPITGDITAFIHDAEDPGSLSDNQVEHIYEDKEGKIWLCTSRGFLNQFVEQDSSFKHWRARDSSVTDLRMFLSLDDPRDPNTLWIAADREIYTFDKTLEEFTLFEHPTYKGIQGAGIFDLKFEGDSLLWMATWGKSLLKYNLRNGSMRTYNYYSEEERANGKYEVVMTIAPRNKDEFWLSTSSGPAIFHKKTGEFRFSTQELERQGESRNLSASRALLVDRTGIAWFGGFEGLSSLDARTHRFLYYPLEASNSTMITRFMSLGVVESPDGKELYVATQDGDGLYVVDQETEQFRRVPLPVDTFPHRSFIYFFDDILLDHQDQLLMVNANALFQYHPEHNSIEPYFTNPQNQSLYNQISPTNLFEDKHGNLWFGSVLWGALKYDLARDSLFQVKHDPENPNSLISDEIVWDIVEDPQGGIWFATRNGISCLNPETGKFRSFPPDMHNPQGLKADNFRDMVIDDQGFLWVGSLFGGIFRLDPEKGPEQEILNLNIDQGLLHNSVTSLRKDSKGQLWAVSEKGLSIIDPTSLEIRNFDEADGMVFLKSGAKVCPGRSGQMYIGVQGGFLKVHPDSLAPNPNLPPVFLENFLVNGKPFQGPREINSLDTLMLEANENFFSFDMVALNFSNASKNQYAYQLEGLDPDWVQAGTRRYVSYSDLGGGWYRLLVKASNNDGIWNPNPKTLVIFVAYPWYQSWWFLLACGIALAGLIYLVIHLRSRQIRKEEQIKSEFMQQIQEVEMAALRAQMNPHFLFNCLNCINRYIVKNEPQKASEYLSDFAVLIRLILNHSQKEQILLSEELKALELYIQMESLRFEEKFEYKISTAPEVDQDFIRVPPLIFQPFVENAIWHGLMHMPSKGFLSIDLALKGDFLECQIKDNGIGRDKARQLKSKSAPLHKSMGMDITASRLDNLGQLNGIHSSIEVVDLLNASNQAQGTLVILKIPV